MTAPPLRKIFIPPRVSALTPADTLRVSREGNPFVFATGVSGIAGAEDVTAERAARIAADADERMQRIAADNAEAQARIAGDASEAAARSTAVANEAMLRANADNAEMTARILADAKLLPLAGGTMTGSLVLYADPATPMEAVTKQYIDARLGSGGGTGGVPEAPNDGRVYGRQGVVPEWLPVIPTDNGVVDGGNF